MRKSLHIVPVLAGLAVVVACKGDLLGPGDSPLINLVNRKYLQGEWVWVDSVLYSSYLPPGEQNTHRGNYILTGTATLEPLDSMDVESYMMTATARLDHADSTIFGEVVRWSQDSLDFSDTVFVRGDTIFGMAVEPIPPRSNATKQGIVWEFDSHQKWCTNWISDTLPAGNRGLCRSITRWARPDSAAVDTTST